MTRSQDVRHAYRLHSHDGPCQARRCIEADGYQCDGCGHYFARGSGTAYADGGFLCRGCRS